MYHAIGMIINIIEFIIPIVDISIIGTSEYLRNDWVDIYFLILSLLNSFMKSNLVVKYIIIAIDSINIAICQI